MKDKYNNGGHMTSLELVDTHNHVSTVIGKHIKITIDCREDYGDSEPLGYLIASAPELLASCKNAYFIILNNTAVGEMSAVKKVLQMAISKAMGEK